MVKFSLLQSTPPLVVAVILFWLLIAFYIVGYRLNNRKDHQDDPANKDLSSINSALLGLLALLLAFTFSMSNSRFDSRRQLIIDEATAIGTVILRTDVYPDSMRQLLRGYLKDYVEVRIAYYNVGMDEQKLTELNIQTANMSAKIWTAATTYAKVDNVTTQTSELLLVLTDMIDLPIRRRASLESSIPDSIMYFLLVICLGSAFLLGYDNRNKFDWIMIIGFALMLSATVFTIIDLDRSRSGLIRFDSFNQKIIELRELLK